MKNKEAINKILYESVNNIITAKQVREAGLHRYGLLELVNAGKLSRVSRGVYIDANAWEDDFYLIQKQYSRGIYSHDTALYLLGYSDRTPSKYTMTFPQGYNAQSLKNAMVEVKHVIQENYEIGLIEVKSPSGNLVRVYDIERTLCDILRGKGSDIQLVNDAMKRYANSKNKDIHKLMKCAEKLKVKAKVQRYMEVLL